MSNNISVVGRLGKDAELKQVGDNQVLEFSVGSDVGYGDKKSTNWFNAGVWGKSAVALEQYLKKGQQVVVHGELTLRKYITNEGVEGTSAEIKQCRVDLVGGKKEQ